MTSQRGRGLLEGGAEGIVEAMDGDLDHFPQSLVLLTRHRLRVRTRRSKVTQVKDIMVLRDGLTDRQRFKLTGLELIYIFFLKCVILFQL